jgi:1-acyl-sn-glycerol-3-phosphate acyltransferase
MKIFDAPSLKFKLIRFVCLILFFPFVRKIRGEKNLPLDKPFIIASNHTSFIDGLLLTTYLSRPLKKNIHYLSVSIHYRNPLFRLLMETAKNIKVELGGEAKALFVAVKYLKDGKIIGLFPEGERSYDGKIKKGKSGAAHLALSAKVPVIPIGLMGTYNILPRNKKFPRYARIDVNVGAPLKFDSFFKNYDEVVEQNDQAKIVEIEGKTTRIIMKEIARLSNQEYPY